MNKRRLSYIFLLVMLIISAGTSLHAQQDSTRQKSTTRIVIQNADLIRNNEDIAPGVQILSGDVQFRHGNTHMLCDSAHYNRSENSFYAMGNVHVNEGDTLTLDCDNMDYIGNEELIKAYGNVRLVNKTTTLTTDTLDYDRIEQRAYYFNNATIRDGKNTLESQIGIYSVQEDMADFYIGVEGRSPEYQMFGDTLHYHTVTKVITIQGPAYIISKENRIYTEYGVYDTNTEISDFSKNTKIYYGDNRMLKGDFVHYDRYKGYARMESNVEIRDTARKVLAVGDVAEYFEIADSAVIPTNPRVAFFGRDTLYMRSDRIEIVPLKDTVDHAAQKRDELIARLTEEPQEQVADTTAVEDMPEQQMTAEKEVIEETESEEPWQLRNDDDFFSGQMYAQHQMSRDTMRRGSDMPKYMRALGDVRYFKTDMAGRSDSITYNQHTKVMTMYGQPLVYAQINQITGDTILVKQSPHTDETDSVLIYSNAFVISQDEHNPAQYNQISGNYIRGKVINDDLRRVHITGNAQVLYYTYDGEGTSVGLNLSKASRMMVMMQNAKVQRIRFIKSPDGQITDLSTLNEEQRYLKGFELRDHECPHNAEEIWGKGVEELTLEFY